MGWDDRCTMQCGLTYNTSTEPSVLCWRLVARLYEQAGWLWLVGGSPGLDF